jgi:hypothetical protein
MMHGQKNIKFLGIFGSPFVHEIQFKTPTALLLQANKPHPTQRTVNF